MNNNSSSKKVATHWPQAGKARQQQQPTTGLTLSNAPTSLANLAQLSGITLLPIGTGQTTTTTTATPSKEQRTAPNNNCNLGDAATTTTTPLRISAPQAASSTVVHNSNRKPAADPLRPPANKKAKTTTEQQPRVFNISSIPSVQSLNQTSNDLIFRRNINVVDTHHSKSRINDHTQSMTSANLARNSGAPASCLTKRMVVPPKTQPKPPPPTVNQTVNNGVQVIPVSGRSLAPQQYMSRPSTQQHQPNIVDMGNIMSDHSTIATHNEHSYVDVNGDANNISLIKLMAILNNPALTITAVGPKEPSDDGHNIFDSFGTQSLSDSKFEPNNLSQARKARAKGNSKPRLPQSAANLEIVHGSQLHESNGMAQLVSVNDLEQRRSCDNFKIDGWLSSCNQNDDQDAVNNQLQYPNETCHETNSSDVTDAADPTILSTSVRNLLMQQISQGTSKQQNRSVQLLRHIANQEQENDDSILCDQNKQLPIAETIFIPGHHRAVQQVTNDVKIIETEQIVHTEGLNKKKPRDPTKTSRCRLYVPGMDNGNLRHSRTNESRYYLNNITIDNRSTKQVHLSDRHSMIDVMMTLNDKGKKNEPIEPDEIFINRPKRVMSKIDTMLERKKRRRFERISGRESPKKNSIEDQCAESEEEWSSDDEAADLDNVTIVRTQLPLEEVETQEKKDHFMSVGLVSRSTKYRIEAEMCERKLNLVTPLAFEQIHEPSDDIQQFIDTIMKTDGEDVQLRVETNIKRNDLPLLEGLNRNTSRLKMSYMNLLGLEKRSKRTTLYKVKQFENTTIPTTGKQTDLNGTSRVMIPDDSRPTIDTQRQLIASVPNSTTKGVSQPAIRLGPSNCRDTFKLPNKDDYMKSLGLMAS